MPYLVNMGEIQKHLSNDLMPKGVGAFTPVAQEAMQDGEGLKTSVKPVLATIHSDISPIHPDMLRHSLRCLLTALQGCSAGSSLVPCLIEHIELMSLCIVSGCGRCPELLFRNVDEEDYSLIE